MPSYENGHPPYDDNGWDGENTFYEGVSGGEVLPYALNPLALSSDDFSEDDQPTEVLIIPGSGKTAVIPKPHRSQSFGMTFLLIVITACIALSALFSITPLGNSAGDTFASSFSAVVDAMVFKQKPQFINYTVRSGDTYDTIASTKDIQLGGIYEANHFLADAEAQIGQTILLPTDPNYGQGYIPPLPAGMSTCGYASVVTNISPAGNNYLFCTVAGQTNGDGVCAPTYQQANGDPSLYDLGNPQAGEANHYVRGFTAYHSGVDMSTGQSGTPLYAVQDGQVIYNNFDSGGGGWSLKINLCGGIAVSYSHMAVRSPLAVGTAVKKGDQVGVQGSTGNSTGPHLHFMIWWDNVPVDPLCAYQNLVGGYGTASSHYNGCPPNIGHKSWP
jgi:LysM repeat protein